MDAIEVTLFRCDRDFTLSSEAVPSRPASNSRLVDTETTTDVAGALHPATVAIVGRPNVGKSALFNRLIGRRLAIVEDTPGVTRDRLYALCDWRGRIFSMVDTAGIDPEADVAHGDEFADVTRRQAEAAAAEADVVVLVVDAQTGLHALDEDVAGILRRKRRPIVLAANKAESAAAASSIYAEFAKLGFGEPVAVSAIHGEGTGDLLDRVVDLLPPQAPDATQEGELALAIIGRPNVGKSSLLNALLGEERTIVSEVPGTTRDAIDTLFTWHQRPIRLIDTAGVRKKPEAHGAIEYYAALRSLNAIARCDIALLVFDSMTGVTAQDRRLAGIAIEERKGLIIVGNKWDLAREQGGEFSQGELANVIHELIPFARFAPITFLSAKTHRRLGSLMPIVNRVAENLDRRIATAQLNSVIRDAVLAHPAPAIGGRLFKVYYASQPATHPPIFVFHCNDPELVQSHYIRFLENVIRQHFDFEGVPLTMQFRARREQEEPPA
ncbi:MAG TPA: ribosome biogenesis GTPase Der [Candidatus Baltobacteraceae bacterium]|nr:ribosome biogenesis GTPase Der [Candidatus Baltobacteraceae bacterium]